MPVGERLVDQGPEALGRLEFGGIGRQEFEVDAFGNDQIRGDVPTGAIEHEHDQIVRSGANLTGEGGEDLAEHRGVDRIGEEPDHLAGGRKVLSRGLPTAPGRQALDGHAGACTGSIPVRSLACRENHDCGFPATAGPCWGSGLKSSKFPEPNGINELIKRWPNDWFIRKAHFDLTFPKTMSGQRCPTASKSLFSRLRDRTHARKRPK
jgi:hypothetical protein